MRALLWLCMLVAALAGCAPGDATVTITVQGAAELETLRVRQRWEPAVGAAGTLQPGELVVQQRLDEFRVQLAGEPRGTLRLVVDGLRGACRVASAAVAVPLVGAGDYAATVLLEPSPGCELRLRVDGGGAVRVLALPALTPVRECVDACTISAAAGQALRLQPLSRGDDSAGGGTAFVGFAGVACDGPGPCDLTVNSEVQEVTARFTARRSCSPDGFCWLQPLPQGNQLRAVVGLDNGEAWAVGGGGTVLHFDRFNWSPVPSGTNGDLTGVWAAGPQDVWMVGDAGVVLRFDGAALRAVDSGVKGGLRGVFGGRVAPTQPAAVWIVGDDGLVLRRDGEHFIQVAGPFGVGDRLNGVFGLNQQDLWVVGENASGQGIAARWDGARLARLEIPAGVAGLNGVWESARGAAWMVGNQGALLRWDGTSLQRLPAPTTDNLTDIHGLPSGEAWVVGLSRGQAYRLAEDGSFTVHATTTVPWLSAVHYTDPATAWAVGYAGAIVRWNGSYWSAPFESSESGLVLLRAVATFDDEVWAVGGPRGVIERWRGDSANVLRASPQLFTAVSGRAKNDIWIVGEETTLAHFDGKFLLEHRPFPAADSAQRLFALCATAGPLGGALFVGGGAEDPLATPTPGARGYLGILDYDADGSAVLRARFSLDHVVRGLWGSGYNDVWAVGGGPNSQGVLESQILRWNGANWRYLRLPEMDYILNAVWGSGPDDVWLAGGVPATSTRQGSAVVLHYDGVEFARMDIPLPVMATAVTGTSARDVWIGFTALGGVFHFNGKDWAAYFTGYTAGLQGLAVRAGEVWGVGEANAVVRRRAP